ncbi:MAG TPA: hypothetical protein VF059_12355 [Casimicrobiaceae bacterium]
MRRASDRMARMQGGEAPLARDARDRSGRARAPKAACRLFVLTGSLPACMPAHAAIDGVGLLPMPALLARRRR